MNVKLLKYPTEEDWLEVKRRALVTVGLDVKNPPDTEWKKNILAARHSPIRYLRFSFYLGDIPYWVAMHLRTHVHDCPNGDEFDPYIKSQRDDRQSKYERGKAPQDQPVNMIIDVSGEQLINLANKRLCAQASKETQAVVWQMCQQAVCACPEFESELVPVCERNGGICYEMFPCGRYPSFKDRG